MNKYQFDIKVYLPPKKLIEDIPILATFQNSALFKLFIFGKQDRDFITFSENSDILDRFDINKKHVAKMLHSENPKVIQDIFLANPSPEELFLSGITFQISQRYHTWIKIFGWIASAIYCLLSAFFAPVTAVVLFIVLVNCIKAYNNVHAFYMIRRHHIILGKTYNPKHQIYFMGSLAYQLPLLCLILCLLFFGLILITGMSHGPFTFYAYVAREIVGFFVLMLPIAFYAKIKMAYQDYHKTSSQSIREGGEMCRAALKEIVTKMHSDHQPE